MDRTHRQTAWFNFLDNHMQALVEQSLYLLDQEKNIDHTRFKDYSFIVFPIARAYEGFLKKFFENIGLIGYEDLINPYFRIGRSLNPDLPQRLQDESWLYDDLLRMCQKCDQPNLAMDMWQVWRQGRNQLFHYFLHGEVQMIELNRAEEIVASFVEIMDRVIECKIENGHS